jgi:protein-L-isoaspartate(D-aspartate) O-methyltransferase
MTDLDQRRRFFAEDLETRCGLRSRALVNAFATVPRERFLRAGPWTVVAGSDLRSGPREAGHLTPDADPAHVYHDVVVVIDPARQLVNGQPGSLAPLIDALDLTPGSRVLHVGCGLGYYTAVMAECVGSAGRIVAIEVDEPLAGEARTNLSAYGHVEVRHGDASAPLGEIFDAIFVNAGVTHPLDVWLDAMAPGGRMVLPLTGTMAAMGPNLGKGVVFLLTRGVDDDCDVRMISFVAIYSAHGIRDPAMNEALGKALMGGPPQWQAVSRLRRDPHAQDTSCWLHGPTWCFSR